MKLAVALLVGLGVSASAQEPPAEAPPVPGGQVKVPGAHAEGEYGGAIPGAPQREKRKSTPGPNTLTWVGFQKLGDTPRVFLRVSSSATPEQTVAGNDLIVRLPGFHLDTKNNARPLNTKYFGTDVVRVRAQPQKGGLEVRVTFAKGARDAKISMEPAPEADGGGTFVYLDF